MSKKNYNTRQKKKATGYNSRSAHCKREAENTRRRNAMMKQAELKEDKVIHKRLNLPEDIGI